MAWVGSVTLYDADGDALRTIRVSSDAATPRKSVVARIVAEVEAILDRHPGIPVLCIQDGAKDLRVLPDRRGRGCLIRIASAPGQSYPNWDPDSAITLANGVYEVDNALLEEIKSDFNVVTQEDDARMEWLSAGYAKLTNISSSDMVHHLGFQENDVILSVSDAAGSVALVTVQDYLEASLTYSSATSLSVTVLRGTTTITLSYSII